MLAGAAILLSSFFVSATPNYRQDITEADRLAWLTDWYAAHPMYLRAERAAAAAGDRRNALYAKFGRLRGEMQTLTLPELSEAIAADLETPVAQNDAALRLRGLTVKGDVDLEWDIEAAHADWTAVQQLAQQLGDDGWLNRSKGELGMIAFLQGRTGEAGKMVEAALQTATKTGDVGGQLRYMGAAANGLLNAGFAQMALTVADRALAFARAHPEAGFPYVIYSTKVLTHLRLQQPDEAERFAKAALGEARSGDRRIKQIELLLSLAKIAEQRPGQDAQVLEYRERAAQLARSGRVRRLLSDAEHDLAAVYRRLGDLEKAEQHARSAVEEAQLAGNRFNFPTRLHALAGIYAARRKYRDADRTYQQAADTVEGIMVNVPTHAAQARLIGVTSGIYADHFVLAAGPLQDPVKAFSIIERARGRALADVLRTSRSKRADVTRASSLQSRTISQLQVQLMRAHNPATRRSLLTRLEVAESRLVSDERRTPLPSSVLADARQVQTSLRPNETLLEYVLAEPRSYCLVITSRGLDLRALPSGKQIVDLVDSYVARLKAGRPTATNAASLFEALIVPALLPSAVQRLVIVPDGRLNLLPFDQLFSDSGKTNTIVTVAPSATVFALLRAPSSPPPSKTRALLAIGDVPYDRPAPTLLTTNASRGADTLGLYDISAPPRLGVLPAARAELDAAIAALGADSVILAGESATESALKAQDLSSFRVLHFAVHGIADRTNPERAALILLSDPDASGEDGLLQPREISRLRLAADVVVLSACETAAGPTIGQEGVLNLARAFLLGGARSVVTTLWTVSDDTSTALMRRFYAAIASGQDVAESLSSAKRSTVTRYGPTAIATVSAFQIVGAGDSRLTTLPSGQTR